LIVCCWESCSYCCVGETAACSDAGAATNSRCCWRRTCHG
jgi:hypothetical protein